METRWCLSAPRLWFGLSRFTAAASKDGVGVADGGNENLADRNRPPPRRLCPARRSRRRADCTVTQHDSCGRYDHGRPRPRGTCRTAPQSSRRSLRTPRTPRSACQKAPTMSHKLIVLPDDTAKPIVDAIDGARKSLNIRMFLFTDTSAARRGDRRAPARRQGARDAQPGAAQRRVRKRGGAQAARPTPVSRCATATRRSTSRTRSRW